MKPKYNRYKFIALPALIVLPVITFALGGVINPNANGDITVTDLNDGANTALASGGLSPAPIVIVQSNASLSGDPVLQTAIRVTAPNYTITNDGNLSGNLDGIFVGAVSSTDITNNGTIIGSTGAGIFLSENSVITNTDLIEGTTGIFSLNGSSIVNSGTIRSTAINGNAFFGGTGNDTLLLTQGSIINGNVLGGAGVNNLTLSGGLTTIGGAGNDIHGNVLGFNTITKEGTGLAMIGTVNDVDSGLSITADTIQINSGALYFNSAIAGSTVPTAEINANGTAVGGTGVWVANLDVITGGVSAGAIPINLDSNPENAVGTFTILGDVVHSPGSFIRMDIIPDTAILNGINSDLIVQNGVGNTYEVTGANLRISSTDVNRVITPGTYTIVDSDEVIIGFNSLGTVDVQFNANTPDTGFLATRDPNYVGTVFTNFFTTPGLADGNTNLVIDVNYDFSSLPGLSPTESALGAALDTLALRAGTGTLGLAEQDLIAALAFSDLDSVQDSLTGLSPESGVAMVAGVINSNYRIHRMLQDHLAQVRNSGSVTMTTPEPVANNDGKGGMTYSQPQEQSTASRGTFWGAVSYDEQDYNGSDRRSDFEGETQAITAGFDYRVSPMFVIGGLLDGSRSDFDNRGGSSEIDSLRAGIYGTYGESMGLYSDFYVGYGKHDLEQDRFAGGILGSRNSSSDSDSLQAMLTFGYTMGNEQVKHGPFAGLEYQSVDADGYNQTGGPFTVGVDGYSIDSMRGLIGYRVNAVFGALRPYASVAYAHEFEDDENFTTARFGGVPFQVSGLQLDSAVIVTAGTGYAFTPNVMMNLGYRGDISVENSGITSHGATLGLSYSF